MPSPTLPTTNTWRFPRQRVQILMQPIQSTHIGPPVTYGMAFSTDNRTMAASCGVGPSNLVTRRTLTSTLERPAGGQCCFCDFPMATKTWSLRHNKPLTSWELSRHTLVRQKRSQSKSSWPLDVSLDDLWVAPRSGQRLLLRMQQWQLVTNFSPRLVRALAFFNPTAYPGHVVTTKNYLWYSSPENS